MGAGATSAPNAPVTSLHSDEAAAPPGAGAPARRLTALEGAGATADSSRSLSAPEPKDRPGLGTTWGENRYSSVTQVPFVRDGSSPSYTATMNYNDERGAAALAGRGPGLYTTAASIGLGGALTLSLRNESGTPLAAYRGGGRTVAIGEHGQRYTIVVQNNTNERFEVVLSVDGLDVIDGRDAGFGKRGYSARLRAYLDHMEALRANGLEAERRVAADPFPNKYAVPPLQRVR